VSELRWITAGESHGPALVGILEGFPSGFPLSVERVDAELARRQGGYGRGGRMRIETDRVALQSGVRAGRTLGSPIALALANADATIERLPVPTNPRPGHADLAGCLQQGHRDPRAVLERASARETAMRVALGGVARQLLERFGVEICAHVVALGDVDADLDAAEAAFAAPARERLERRAASAFFALDPGFDARASALVDAAKESGDTLGGVFEVRVLGLPPGLGSYQTAADRLTARLGGALFSIPAIKGVEFGLGFATARRRGSAAHDAIVAAPDGSGPAGTRYRRATNRAGGLEGGLSTGEPLVARVAMKPIPTLRRGLPTVDFATLEPVAATWQRSDVTSVPAASVVGEALIALELARAFRAKFGGDTLAEIERAHAAYLAAARAV
jgi:chorismate synthase